MKICRTLGKITGSVNGQYKETHKSHLAGRSKEVAAGGKRPATREPWNLGPRKAQDGPARPCVSRYLRLYLHAASFLISPWPTEAQLKLRWTRSRNRGWAEAAPQQDWSLLGSRRLTEAVLPVGRGPLCALGYSRSADSHSIWAGETGVNSPSSLNSQPQDRIRCLSVRYRSGLINDGCDKGMKDRYRVLGEHITGVSDLVWEIGGRGGASRRK